MVTNADINDIANLWILLCNENETTISPLKLQKLLYYTQAWHWVYFKEADLFADLPQAWVNGPVYPSVYERFREIGIYDQLTPNNTNITISLSESITNIGFDNDEQQLLDALYRHYGLMSHDRLVFLTHSELPWSRSREGLSPFEPSQNIIPKEVIVKYYSDRLRRKKEKNGNI